MLTLEYLQKQIQEIKKRNKKVETDKAWETSWTRRFIIIILTYIVIAIFFWTSKLSRPFLNAIVPSLAFIISTLTISFAKKTWVNRINKKNSRSLLFTNQDKDKTIKQIDK